LLFYEDDTEIIQMRNCTELDRTPSAFEQKKMHFIGFAELNAVGLDMEKSFQQFNIYSAVLITLSHTIPFLIDDQFPTFHLCRRCAPSAVNFLNPRASYFQWKTREEYAALSNLAYIHFAPFGRAGPKSRPRLAMLPRLRHARASPRLQFVATRVAVAADLPVAAWIERGHARKFVRRAQVDPPLQLDTLTDWRVPQSTRREMEASQPQCIGIRRQGMDEGFNWLIHPW